MESDGSGPTITAEILSAHRAARVEAARAEIQSVLARFGCRLTAEVVLRGARSPEGRVLIEPEW